MFSVYKFPIHNGEKKKNREKEVSWKRERSQLKKSALGTDNVYQEIVNRMKEIQQLVNSFKPCLDDAVGMVLSLHKK